MNKSIKRWTILLVTLAIITALLVGYRIYNKPHRSAAEGPALVLNAADLAAAYNKNEADANKQYLGKTLELTGVVDAVLENQQHGKTIMLQGDAMSGVQCAMLDSAVTAVKGDSITIRGFCNGFLADVVMDRCILIVPDKSNK